MNIYVNGELYSVPGKISASALLETIPHPPLFAFEADGRIIPPAQYDSFTINENSKIEIVGFIGGG